MATIYSLICWGGRLGKSVTVNASTDLVTLTNHGLRNSTGVAFTSGTLPTVSGAALALNTIYFAKSIASNTFELYYDNALTSKINFTSTGSSLIMKSAYFLGLASLSRWGDSGSERIYDSYATYKTARNSVATAFDEEFCELLEAFDDFSSSSRTLRIGGSPKTTVTPSVNGVKTSAHHGGIQGEGYCFVSDLSGVSLGGFTEVSGISVKMTNPSTSNYAVVCGVAESVLRNCIVTGAGGTTAGGVMVGSADTLSCVEGNLIVGFAYGLVNYGANYGSVANNTITKCTVVGVYSYGGGTSNRYGFWYNNISVGNTVNWGVEPTSLQGAAYNAGVAGDTVWDTGTTAITMSTSDFVSWGTTTPSASDNYRPASDASPQVDVAQPYFQSWAIDLAGNVRPSYKGGAATASDLGCYEFDHGYGPWPASHTLTLENVVVGSRVHIRDQAKTIVHHDAIAASSTVVITVTLYGDARDAWFIDIRKASAAPFYKRYTTRMTAAPGASSHYVNQPSDQG